MPFINTKRKDTVEALVSGLQNRLKNPYYMHTDSKPTIVKYWNQDIKSSTLDEGAKISYNNIGQGSPIKYNKINGLFIYGMEKIALEFDNGDFGTEANPIEGKITILPNTIRPYPGDCYSIPYTKQDLLFRITNVSTDTLENGANVYQADFKMEYTYSIKEIEAQTLETYEMVIDNVGTSYNPIIRTSEYNLIEDLQDVLLSLKKYYKNIFYSPRVQSFILIDNDTYFYDAYLTEFLIRNKILSGDDEFLFITQQMTLSNTFILDYDKTFFRCVELKKINDDVLISSKGIYIDDMLSLLVTRIEDYFSLEYNPSIISHQLSYLINNIDSDLILRIKNNQLFHPTDDNIFLDIIIKYFNNVDIDSTDIDKLKNIDYKSNISLFYMIPIIIFCIESKIKNILVKQWNSTS